MALTTRAIVLQRLGLADDSNPAPAIVVYVTSGSFSVSINQTTRFADLSQPSSAAYDLTESGFDTLTELAATFNALTGIECAVVTGVSGSVASTLLPTQTLSVAAGAFGYLTWAEHSPAGAAALVDQLITEADAAIGRYCNRFNPTTGAQTFESAARDEKYDGNEEDTLTLRNYPVTAVTAVSTIDASGTETTMASTEYRADLGKGRLYYLGAGSVADQAWSRGMTVDEGPAYFRSRVGWPAGFQNIRVQYTAGYSTVPADLQSAATQIVVDLYLNRRWNPHLGTFSMVGTTFNVAAAADEVTARYARLLDPYRRVAI